MSTDQAEKNVDEHETKVKGGGDKLQAQSEHKLRDMSEKSARENDAKDNAESKPKSALDDQPEDSDPS